jgi:hypothetical protein
VIAVDMGETNGLLRAILEQQTAASSLDKALANPGKLFVEGEMIPIGTVSKLELCKQWFIDHPEDRALTGRDLEALRLPQGIKVSRTYWNQAKKGQL